MTSDHKTPFIKLESVRKSFIVNGQPFAAVSDVSMSIAEGELVSIVGPSGCGKSTVLKILSGLHTADGGVIEIGNDESPFIPGRDIGMVFQQALLLNWRNIRDNVLLPAEILGLPRKESIARADDLLELVGLTKFKSAYPRQLSGGMQQRASIARALVHDPKLVLMDEPFGALDALTRERMNLELLNIWRKSRKTILFVTHGIQEAVLLGTQVAVMTPSPARMADHFRIELPEPRTLSVKTSEKFGRYTKKIYDLLGVE